jgi:hypothetical protein
MGGGQEHGRGSTTPVSANQDIEHCWLCSFCCEDVLLCSLHNVPNRRLLVFAVSR